MKLLYDIVRNLRFGLQLFTMILIYFVKQGSTCIVNAASERDIAVFAAGMIQARYPVVLIVFLLIYTFFGKPCRKH